MVAFRRSLESVSRLVLASSFFLLSWVDPSPADGSHGGHGHTEVPSGGWVGHGNSHDLSSGGWMGHGNPNVLNYNPGIFLGYGAAGYYAYSPPLVVIGPGGFAPFLAPAFPQGIAPFANGNGLNLPTPPPGFVNGAQPARPLRSNPARSKELTEIGDRSFRGHNIKRAEDKYKLAVKADPTSPIPHVHLAQVSVARGNYSAAADHLRDAVTVAGDGTWLFNTPDIQAIFGEPGDFARQLARIETHLQANPNDRDAWFVLGAETYLSGRTRQAFDVFQRLTDRRTDEALTAFIDASRPRPAAN
jgi:tetratricopeptide (TPR) repeat protein